MVYGQDGDLITKVEIYNFVYANYLASLFSLCSNKLRRFLLPPQRQEVV